MKKKDNNFIFFYPSTDINSPISCVHIKTSTLTATGLKATSRQDANCKATFTTQTSCDR